MKPAFPVSRIAIGDGGQILLSACPGAAGRDVASLDRDLRSLRRSGATGLLSLIESQEFPHGIAEFSRRVEESGLGWAHIPIRDFDVPTADFEKQFTALDLPARTRRGEVWAIHCRAGLGRTGMIAARLLVEAGLPPQDAIRTIRENHDARAIETDDQQDYVLLFNL